MDGKQDRFFEAPNIAVAILNGFKNTMKQENIKSVGHNWSDVTVVSISNETLSTSSVWQSPSGMLGAGSSRDWELNQPQHQRIFEKTIELIQEHSDVLEIEDEDWEQLSLITINRQEVIFSYDE